MIFPWTELKAMVAAILVGTSCVYFATYVGDFLDNRGRPNFLEHQAALDAVDEFQATQLPTHK